jgi:hypothetical protein
MKLPAVVFFLLSSRVFALFALIRGSTLVPDLRVSAQICGKNSFIGRAANSKPLLTDDWSVQGEAEVRARLSRL